MSWNLSAFIGSALSAASKSPVQKATTVHLWYPSLPLAGITTDRQLSRHLRLVASDLFDQHQAHLASVHALLPNKASWTKVCLAMTNHPDFLGTEVLICIRQINHLGSPHLLLCQAFAEELLRRCPDGTKTIKTEGHFLDDPSLPEELQSHCTTHTITVSNGQLLIQD